MADHSKPANTSLYTAYTTEINDRFTDITLGLDSALVTATNLPTNAIRWNSTLFRHQRWNGTAWSDFTRYDININGSVGATTPNTGAFTTLSSTGNTTLGDASADTLTVNATPTFNVAIPATSGGTGQNSYAVGDILVGGATNTLVKVADIATGNVLLSGGVGAAPSYGKVGLATHVSGTLPATSGGTGLTTYAIGDLLVGATTNTVVTLADVATGNVLLSGGVGASPSYGKVGLTTHISGTLGSGNGGTGLTTFTSGGAVYATSTSALTTGTLPATAGGTGQSTYAIGDLLVGGATNTLVKVADIAVGNVLLSGGVGVAPSYGKVDLTSHITGTLGLANGGTNATTADGARVTLNIITGTTGSEKIPSGTTAQRDSTPAAGYFRYNTTLNQFEGYNGSSWGSVGGGATGGGGDKVFIENSKTITTSYTITSGTNAMSTGPVTLGAGVTITVPSGSRWVIL